MHGVPRHVIFQLAGDWLAIDYNVFSRNCIHFAQAFVARLGVGGLPPWVDRLTRVLGIFVPPGGSSFVCSQHKAILHWMRE